MGKSAPAAPDYRSAAIATGESSKEVTRDQTYANRPNQYTPWGSSTWESSRGIDPATGKPVSTWEQNIRLSPDQQQALDSQQRIQAGRSGIAEGLLGRAAGDLAQPFDYGGLPQPAGTPQAPDYYGQGLSQMGQAPDTNLPSTDPFANAGRGGEGDPFSQITNWGEIPGQGGGGMMGGAPGRGTVPGAGGGALPGRGAAPGTESYQSEAIQRNLDFSGAPQVGDVGDIRNRAEDAIYNRSTSRLDPQFQQREEALQSQLYNQGLRPGDEAFDRAMTDFGTSRTDAYQTAMNESIMGGGVEAERQFGMNLAGRQQSVGETSQQGGFANQASQQALNQQLGIGGQRFQQGMMGAQLSDQQRAQAQGEQAQQFGQGMQSGQMTDQQRAQYFQEQNQGFGQGMQSQQAQQGLQGQQFQQAAQLRGEAAGAAGGQFDQQMRLASMADQQRQQQVSEQLAFGGQGYQQQMQGAAFQNQLRQQAIAEQMQKRGMSINEINALMTGQQVQTPGMPSFMGATKSAAVDYSGAAQSAGQYGLDKFSADQAMMQSVLSGASSIGAAFAGSDLALKDEIRVIGSKHGLQRISWKWNKAAKKAFGYEGYEEGYSAREVEAKYPEYVSRRKGYQVIYMDALERELEAA